MANRSLLHIAAAVLWIGSATAVLAQSSASYRLDEHVLNAGGAPDGGAPASDGFRLSLVAIGDGVGVGGAPSSASYDVGVGFSAAYPPPGEVNGLLFQDASTLTWNPERSVGAYNVYRGQVSTLTGLQYGTCAAPRVPGTTTQDFDTPPAGDAFFYLVTAVNRLAEEGTLGSDSFDSERTGGGLPMRSNALDGGIPMQRLTTAILLILLGTMAHAAPDAINYQGVLRDSAGAPLAGSFDMTFRFFDAASGGGEILVDEHLASDAGAVSVTGGLFNVRLGSGDVYDGGGTFPGEPYTSLTEAFTDFSDIWIEIQIGVEVLSPRVKVVSAGHALNADSASSLYFNDGTPWGRSLKWDDSLLRFDTLSGIGATGFYGGILDGSVLRSSGNAYLNWNGPDGNARLYFHNDFVNEGESLSWYEPLEEFRLSAGLRVEEGLVVDGPVTTSGSIQLQSGSVFMGLAGPDQDLSIYFYEDGSPSGERFYWNNAADAFYVTDGFYSTGELRTLSSQIVINDDGPNGNQDIEFYNNGTQTERFQWDNAAQRFEMSDDLYVFGSLAADIKNFVQNHPHRDDLEIVYSSLEGNEVTTFTRGSGRLAGGEARIELEESFRFVTNPDIGLSVHLTPRGASSDLYVESISTHELVVRSGDGPDVPFDFVVYGLRIGYEEHPVYRPKRAEAFAPRPGHYADDFAAEPGLARHTARSRYREMATAVHGKANTETAAAAELLEAIGMRELNLDYPRGSAIPVREMNRRARAEGASRIEEAPSPPASTSVDATQVAPVVETAPREIPAADVATLVTVEETVEPGDVLVIDPAAPNSMMLARYEAEPTVSGIVTDEPGVVLHARGPVGNVSVAVGGVVLCRVDAAYGAIRPGDLLQTSPTPGHAMRADDPRAGGVLGKALEPLEVGTGLVRVLVTLR